MKKKLLALLTATFIIIPNATTFAGTWESKVVNSGRTFWKYKNDDASYIQNGWQFIDGEWYHFENGHMECNETIYSKSSNGMTDLTKPKYFVGADGKMIKNGWYKENDNYSWFVDNEGKIVEGFFMVDGVLYKNVDSTEGSGTTRAINTTYRGKKREKFMGVDGKEHTLDYIRDGGKVLELDGNPIREDDKFWDLIPYIPKYNSQGILVGEIKN